MARGDHMTPKGPKKSARLVVVNGGPVLVRVAKRQFGELTELLFSRYPNYEWATFARFGWRDTPAGLVLTIVRLEEPTKGDLNSEVGNVAIDEQYSLRMALSAEKHGYGVGVIHSHPEDCRTHPSSIDDDMDSYYADYFSSFAPNRPYTSLIFSRGADGELHGTGRVYWEGRWHSVERFAIEGFHVFVDDRIGLSAQTPRVARLASAFGSQAADRLANATVAIVGAGGTGSPAVEVLARSGVGHIITIDPDTFSESNLERVHGSAEADCELSAAKVSIAARHVASINSRTRVTAIRGALPQPGVMDELIHADIVLGCTDQHHSRLALSDAALRYILPTIDVGVDLEGADGRITGQVIQLVRMFSEDPCALCRRMIHSWKVAQELMPERERSARRTAANEARARGEEPNNYWHEMPQLNTVGYLTTIAGAMAAGYAIGLLTSRFAPPFARLQMNLSAQWLDVTDGDDQTRDYCDCRLLLGTADQGGIDPFVSAPSHWPSPIIYRDPQNPRVADADEPGQ